MVSFFGLETPTINITGFLSSTWFYIVIIGFIGLILIIAIFLLLFFITYNRRIVVFENISGQGYQPVLKTRARIIKLGSGGEEVLKTMMGGHFLTAYGRKMGKNTYWFAKGSDGYLYNLVLGDLDTKMAMLDIEPVDRDVRMFRVALDRLSRQTYEKQKFMERYGVQIIMFLFLIVLILGMWFIIGKIGDATTALASTAETNKEVVELLPEILRSADNIKSGSGGSGLVPADGG